MLMLIVVKWIMVNVGVIQCSLRIKILHNNDIHGRFEETSWKSGICKVTKNQPCIAGSARTAALVKKFRKEAAEGKGPPVLFLNAGDTFVGTVWYTVHTWKISYDFMNALNPDVACLGNHEFDKGTDELDRFVSALNFPIIGGNTDFSKVPKLLPKIPKSVVLTIKGVKVGVVGHVTTTTLQVSQPGDTIFLDEVESVKAETERLYSQGVRIFIILGHSGHMKDKEIARRVPLADVVVGGHTNTFLWNGPTGKLETEYVEGPYPTVVSARSYRSRRLVPVVQAYAYTKYLGVLDVTFDDRGEVIGYVGQPITMHWDIAPDEDVLNLLEKYRPEVDKVSSQVLGTLLVTLDGDTWSCRHQECNVGNLIVDSLVLYKASISPVTWTEAPIAIVNAGSIRATIDLSDNKQITKGDVLAVLPFENQVVTLTLKGKDLWTTFELCVRSNGETNGGEFLQVSGIRVVYNLSQPVMSRVVSIKTRCGRCNIPTYQPIDLEKEYGVVMFSFTAAGNDGLHTLKDKGYNRKTEELSDADVLAWYVEKNSPVFSEIQGRILFVGNSSTVLLVKSLFIVGMVFASSSIIKLSYSY